MSLSRWSQDDVSCGTLPSLSEKDGPIRSIYEDRPRSCLSLQDGTEGAGAVSGLSQIPAPESLDEAVALYKARHIVEQIEGPYVPFSWMTPEMKAQIKRDLNQGYQTMPLP